MQKISKLCRLVDINLPFVGIKQVDDNVSSLKKLNIAGNNLIIPDAYDEQCAAVTTGNYKNIYVASSNDQRKTCIVCAEITEECTAVNRANLHYTVCVTLTD